MEQFPKGGMTPEQIGTYLLDGMRRGFLRIISEPLPPLNPVRRAKRKLMRELKVSPRQMKKLKRAVRRERKGKP